MRALNSLPILLAMGDVAPFAPSDPFVCFADGDGMGEGYATEGELGYYDANGRWVPADYATVGQLARLPMFNAAQRSSPAASVRLPPAMMRTSAPSAAPAARAVQAQPFMAPGLTQAQVENIVRQTSLSEAQVRRIVQECMSQMAPYGQVPSRVSPDEALFPMGLGFVILSGGPPAVLTGQFTNSGQGILPQRAFRGERLVLTTFRSAGVPTVPVIVDTFKVGDYSQLVGGAPVPVETFAPDAFGVRLMLDGAVPGVTYTLSVQIPAAIGLPAGETVTVVGAVLGRTGEASGR